MNGNKAAGKGLCCALLSVFMLAACSSAGQEGEGGINAMVSWCFDTRDRMLDGMTNGMITKRKAKKSVEMTMRALTEGGDLGQAPPRILDGSGAPLESVTNTGIAQLILEEMDVKVESVEAEEGEGEAVLAITVPDGGALLKEAVSRLSREELEQGDAKPALAYAEEAVKDGDYETKTFSVTVALREVEGQWYLENNQEFANALSGGLLDAFPGGIGIG